MKTMTLVVAVLLIGLESGSLVAAQEHAAMKGTTTPSAVALRQDMRKLWTDHVVWTRDYIVAAVVTTRARRSQPIDCSRIRRI